MSSLDENNISTYPMTKKENYLAEINDSKNRIKTDPTNPFANINKQESNLFGVLDKEYIKDDENKSFMHSLIDLVKTGYLRLSNAERTALWGLSKDMLKHVIEYKKATGDFI